jgi:micrococcal nuclease
MKKPKMLSKIIVAGSLLLFLAAAAHAQDLKCYQWPLRGDLAYDGDTIYITVPELPEGLQKMSVRLEGIDTPELRGKCALEKQMARETRDLVRSVLSTAQSVQICNPRWGKYGGRMLGEIVINGVYSLKDLLLMHGHAREYDGGKRQGWCGSVDAK